jgi:hypothetical protein
MRLGRDPVIHHPDAPRITVEVLDAGEELGQRGRIGSVAGVSSLASSRDGV